MTDAAHRPTSRGRIVKREAILDAALKVFAQDGYPAASIDRIVAVAGVSKPTVYNHFADKEALFRTVMCDAARHSAEKIIASLDTLSDDGAELANQLTKVAYLILECQLSDEGWVLQRLLYAEAVHMPDLYDTVLSLGSGPVVDALAGRLARLANRGHLDIDDPESAANQFMTLVAGNLPALSALGTRPIHPIDLDAAVTAGVRTFLRAFAARRRPRGPARTRPALATAHSSPQPPPAD
ncbi:MULTISPECIES: TetR/AcrR family transcriptional regulator [Protofrankia]|uniref:Regulatory protein TetR n=1 Tax=Candidatus Protofrankia datiscae TaxID=2716812 RepID=F8AWP6_9ACTN|nr:MULTISPECIES: TetR/AcrR family transcriptional regulator [Protofrankia]AEH09390.1 regulatory protein TetR [Candidatus Protofrankia datiscae]